MRKTKKQKALKILLYTILIIYAFVTFYPFMWAVAASFKPLAEITSGNLSLWSDNFTLEQYRYLFDPVSGSLFPQWLMNSIIISVIGTTVNIFLNTMAGYALARLSFLDVNAFIMAF